MQILKYIILTILAIVALVFIVALFLEKNYSVSRSIEIKKPKQIVFDYLRYLKNQDNWSVWAKMDPDMKKSFTGQDGTVGFTSAWEGKKMGQGQQKITKIDEGNKIEYELKFIKPFKSISPTTMETIAVNDSTTKIKWDMTGTMPYPINIMRLFMSMDKQLGGDFDKGLASLKTILEK